MILATPQLQTAMRDMWDRLEDATAEALAERTGISPEQPEPRIAAAVLIGLWRLQADGIRRCATEGRGAAETEEIVRAEVQRAARVAESGLWWFGEAAGGKANRQQMKTAAETAAAAGRQIVTALRQARAAWEQLHLEGGQDEDDLAVPAFANLLEETVR